MSRALFTAREALWPIYKDALENGFREANLDIELTRDRSNPENIDYIIYAPTGPVTNFSRFTNVKLVQSIWAGVDTALNNKTLTQTLARMVDPGMSAGMSDYVLGHVMRHHLGTDRFANAQAGEWLNTDVPYLARQRTVGFLGIGELGMYCAHSVAKQGFNVIGWSRNLKTDDIISCYAGDDGLNHVLEQSDILVLLMPDTPQTQNIINKTTIRKMKSGVCIINPGRGTLINDTDLIDALNTNQVAAATLDVFRTEPLPDTHPYWAHPNVLVTPHIASETRLETAIPVVIENLKRGEDGKPFLHLVDRSAGY